VRTSCCAVQICVSLSTKKTKRSVSFLFDRLLHCIPVDRRWKRIQVKSKVVEYVLCKAMVCAVLLLVMYTYRSVLRSSASFESVMKLRHAKIASFWPLPPPALHTFPLPKLRSVFRFSTMAKMRWNVTARSADLLPCLSLTSPSSLPPALTCAFGALRYFWKLPNEMYLFAVCALDGSQLWLKSIAVTFHRFSLKEQACSACSFLGFAAPVRV